jgi:hypothetical protein
MMRVAGNSPASRLLRSIVETLVPEGFRPPDATVALQVLDDVTAFVTAQVHMLPRRLHAAFVLGLVAFALWARLRGPRGFAAQPRAVRVALVNAWAFGGWAPGRKLFRLIRSTALLAFYEHALVTAEMVRADVHAVDGSEP